MIEIHALGASNLYWGEQDTLIQHPIYKIGTGTYPRNVSVDPEPCYTHDYSLVRDVLDRCWREFPLTDAGAALYMLSHEYVGRNNGYAYLDYNYYLPNGDRWPETKVQRKGKSEPSKLCAGQSLFISICGKRIPPLPTMTKYLVSHEYGHLAAYRTAHLMGYQNDDEMYKDYAALRGCPEILSGTPGVPRKWHQRIAEVVANDFRIMVMKMVTDFWPHDVAHPYNLVGDVADDLYEWWVAAGELCKTGKFDPAILVPEEKALSVVDDAKVEAD